MTVGSIAAATHPPHGLPGLDPDWSRLVTTPDSDGIDRTWHILDNHVVEPELTLLCVHGNPTWSYLWRDLLAKAPDGVRVIAVDQLDMGFSERTGTTRRLAQRIDDLSSLTDALELSGRVVTVAHDWGGPISLGWAEEHLDQLAGVVLTNTAVHQPEGARAPSLIRMVRLPGVLKATCQATAAFVRGTLALSRPRPTKGIRQAFEAPYRTSARRAAIAEFVEDIPLDEGHPSHATLSMVAANMDQLVDIPSLLLWGPSDPVFSDLYLHDLEERLPNAETHRFVGSSHLVTEDAGVASAVYAWVDQLGTDRSHQAPPQSREPLIASIERRASDDSVAIVEMGPDGQEASITFSDLASDIDRIAGGLVDLGVRRGDRIAMLVTPGVDLAACIFATWRVGAVVVVADTGLGLRGMGRALASADPDYLIGIPEGLSVARTMRWPGVRICTVALSPLKRGLLGVEASLDDLRERGRGISLPEPPLPTDLAAVGFTSGSTGPAKGVAYRHHQLQAQRDAIADLYGIDERDALVAAFGPFAMFGTLMGIPSVVPDMRVTSPGSLTAGALAAAAEAVAATLVFASPAAMRNFAATSDELTSSQRTVLSDIRLLLSAGAPVHAEVLESAAGLMPNAEAHTPYGMTEVMPVADVDLAEITSSDDGEGVLVGTPVAGVEVMISEIDSTGRAVGPLTSDAGVVGEVCIRADHMRDGYDRLWMTHDSASQPHGWHRSGDVGHLDGAGRLWIEGRIGHTITTASGPVTPVGVEHAVEGLDDVSQVAAVGVGPVGTQQVVVVLTRTEPDRRSGLADEELSDRVRGIVGGTDVAAVLTVPALPVDKRHNSKIDRTRVSAWAAGVLSGDRMGRI